MLTDPVKTARTLAIGRAAIGAAMMVAPTLSVRGWLGEDAKLGSTRAVVRSFGARELLLGGLAAHVLERPGVGRRMVASLAACDAIDIASTWLSRRSLPATALPMLAVVAGGAAAAGLRASSGLPEA